MAETTNIAWCDSTWNPWIGCQKAGPGCDNCYAEALDRRYHAGIHWGPDAIRKLTSDSYWRGPLGWNRKAAKLRRPWRVFCASQADVFDNKAPEGARDRLWALIRETPHLTWLLVTKRIGNAPDMLPADWGSGYPNVWLLSTVVTQEEADRDIPKLLNVPAVVHGLSIEPQLGLVIPKQRVDWAITGGESAQFGRCREYALEWPQALLTWCHNNEIAFFMKQLGSKPTLGGKPYRAAGKGDDMAQWPADLRVRQFPRATP